MKTGRGTCGARPRDSYINSIDLPASRLIAACRV
jgi:hypothetical protein